MANEQTEKARRATVTPQQEASARAAESQADANRQSEDLRKRAVEKKGKDPAELSGEELLDAAVRGELSTATADTLPVRQPIGQYEEKVEAQNGLPYVGVDEQFMVNPDLIEERNEQVTRKQQDREGNTPAPTAGSAS